MSKENLDKTIKIYDDLKRAIISSDSILKLAMKYVPLSTKDGLNLHNRYDELIRLLNRVMNTKY